MRVSREKAAENRERILAAASRAFRERGFDGVGVADVMQEAGLTHGGFYGHFESKEDLMAQACARSLENALAKWARLAEQAEGDPFAAVAADYLSADSRDRPGQACLLAALAGEVPRRAGPVRRAFTEGLRGLAAALERLSPGRGEARRRRALASLSTLVGALALSRAVDDPDLSDEILRAAVESLRASRRSRP